VIIVLKDLGHVHRLKVRGNKKVSKCRDEHYTRMSLCHMVTAVTGRYFYNKTHDNVMQSM